MYSIFRRVLVDNEHKGWLLVYIQNRTFRCLSSKVSSWLNISLFCIVTVKRSECFVSLNLALHRRPSVFHEHRVIENILYCHFNFKVNAELTHCYKVENNRPHTFCWNLNFAVLPFAMFIPMQPDLKTERTSNFIILHIFKTSFQDYAPVAYYFITIICYYNSISFKCYICITLFPIISDCRLIYNYGYIMHEEMQYTSQTI